MPPRSHPPAPTPAAAEGDRGDLLCVGRRAPQVGLGSPTLYTLAHEGEETVRLSSPIRTAGCQQPGISAPSGASLSSCDSPGNTAPGWQGLPGPFLATVLSAACTGGVLCWGPCPVPPAFGEPPGKRVPPHAADWMARLEVTPSGTSIDRCLKVSSAHSCSAV